MKIGGVELRRACIMEASPRINETRKCCPISKKCKSKILIIRKRARL